MVCTSVLCRGDTMNSKLVVGGGGGAGGKPRPISRGREQNGDKQNKIQL